jgi:hypothetical protein
LETVTLPPVRGREFFHAYSAGRRDTEWEMAARIFDMQPDLEHVVDLVYDSDNARFPDAIAAIVWESLGIGLRNEVETASLRADLIREALDLTAGDWDLKQLSDEVEALLNTARRNEEALVEHLRRRAEANGEVAQ